MEILRDPPESNEIQFLEDGSWRPMEVEVKKEPHFLSPPTPNSSSINLGLFGSSMLLLVNYRCSVSTKTQNLGVIPPSNFFIFLGGGGIL